MSTEYEVAKIITDNLGTTALTVWFRGKAMSISTRTLCIAFVCLWQLPGCATAELAACDDPDPRIVRTKGSGAEDIVALPLANGHTRLFVREVCGSLVGCEDAQYRIGYVDIDPNGSPQALETAKAWRPSGDEQEFKPLGLSLIPSEKPGFATLFLIDALTPVQIWRLAIDDGVVTRPERFWPDKNGIEADPIKSANDLHAHGNSVYVSRFDFLGILPWRSGSWHGIIRLKPPVGLADVVRGANGVVDTGSGGDLVVADYWEARLRFVPENQGDKAGFATEELDIHPDNLTRDKDTLIIAGQRHSFMATLNLLASFLPSPSAVYSIQVDELGPNAKPRLLWDGGWLQGRSVSVAVPVPKGLALGQIRAADILLIRCSS